MSSAPLSTTNISRQLYGVCGICGVQGGTVIISLRVGVLRTSPFIILPPMNALLIHSLKPTLNNLETESIVISISSVRSLNYCSTSDAILILFNLVLLQLNMSLVLSPTTKETSSEACQGRARFQQHRDASCHQVYFFLQRKAPKEFHAILTQTLACSFPGRAKDLSAPL